MLNKKIFLILIILLLTSLNLTPALAQQPPGISELPKGSEQLAEKIANPEEIIEDAESKWDYLGKEWKNILLKNSIIKKIDSFFTKISFIFRILFGQTYSLSITLFFVVILWFFIFIFVGNILKSSGFIRGVPAYLIGLVPAIILAQLDIFRKIVVAVGTFVFSREAKWARITLAIVAIFVLILLFAVSEALSKYLEKRRKLTKEKEAELSQEKIKRFSEGLEKARQM